MEKIYKVCDFGTLFEGENVTAEQKDSNSKAIHSALFEAGKNGGGTVLIPEGTYCFDICKTPEYLPEYAPKLDTACIFIAYDNIVLAGAGMKKTFIKTKGDFSVVNGRVKRAYGIRIIPNEQKPLEHIILKDFDLDGGCHGTGNVHWPADVNTGDGWDISHKGICLHGGQMGTLEFERICVHGYKGELWYADTMIRNVNARHCQTYDTNGQCFNTSAQNVLAEYCQFGKEGYINNTFIEFANYNRFGDMPDGGCIFRNCYFTGNHHNGISFNEGHNDNYSILFENNVIDLHMGITYNGVACFVFDGGTSGPVTIRNNTIVSREGSISVFNSDCWEPRHRHLDENFVVENNLFVGFRAMVSLVSAYGAPNEERMTHPSRYEKQLKNMVFRNNVVESYTGEGSRPVVILGNDKETMIDYLDNRWQSKCLSYFENIVIENNTFNNSITPWLRDHYGTAPIFRNNLYNNVTLKVGESASYSAIQPVSKEHNRVVPVFEYLYVTAKEETKVRLRTHNPMDLMCPAYEDGYEVLIGGAKGTAPVHFIKDATNAFEENVVIDENSYMRVRYNKELTKWELVELIKGKLEYSGLGADTSKLIGADMSQQIGTEDTVIKTAM